MKERWQELDRGRKIIILLQPVMFILFLIIFLSIGHHQVISYRSGYLRYERQEDAVLCSGRVDGHDLQYVVTAGSVVEFWLDGALDSTYTITDDPTAVPQAERTEYPRQDYLTGVEIQKDGQVWFRGAYSPYSDYWLVAEDGTNLSYDIVVNRPEPAPTPGVILYIAGNPETSPRGYGPGLFFGLLFSIACVVTILLENELFYLQMSFRVQDPYGAEPSDWELLSRWVGWIVFTCLALMMYVLGSGLVHMS